MIPNIVATVERIKAIGLSLCDDLDDDCQLVYDHANCWRHTEGTGTCPYLCAVREPLLWGGRHLGLDAFKAIPHGDAERG